MKHYTFRCVKITFEEKETVKFVNGDEVHTHQTLVEVHFANASSGTNPMHGHGFAMMTLSDEQFKELGYRVGQEYVLAGTVTL